MKSTETLNKYVDMRTSRTYRQSLELSRSRRATRALRADRRRETLHFTLLVFIAVVAGILVYVAITTSIAPNP